MIRASIDAAALASALREGCAQIKGTMPILAHALIEADDGGVRITTTDLQVLTATRIGATVVERGALCARVDLLSAALTGGGQVELVEEDFHLVVKRSPRSRMRVPTLPAADWPQPDGMAWCSAGIEAESFARAVNAVAYAANRTNARAFCRSVMVTRDYVAATDGHRLAIVDGEFGNNPNLLIPIEAVSHLQRALADGGQAELGGARPGQVSTLAVSTDSQRTQITLIADGNLPSNLRGIIPSGQPVGEVVVDVGALRTCIKRVRAFCTPVNENRDGVRVVLLDGTLHLESLDAENRDALSAEQATDCIGGMRHGINIAYLQDFLETCAVERASIACHEMPGEHAKHGFVLRAIGDGLDATHVIAGVRA